MAKIVYGLSGEGSGHSSRSREMITYLLGKGHQVKAVSYDRGYRNLKDDFDIMEVTGLRMVNKDNKISITKTFAENFNNISKVFESSEEVKQKMFKDYQPDLVITDFEPMTAYLANYFDLPLITIDNQHRFRYMEFPCPTDMKAEAIFVENLIRAIVPRPSISLITTFYFGNVKNDRALLFPPILRRKIQKTESRAGNHILVYVTQAYDQLPEVLKTFDRETFYIYGYNREGQDDNLTFKGFDRDGFRLDLASCKCIIGTAGFTLITEALALRKPYCSIPVQGQFEQVMNAIMLEELGYGKNVSELTRETISSFLYDLPDFAEKVKQYRTEDNSKIEMKLEELLADNFRLLKEYHSNRQLTFLNRVSKSFETDII